jgi:hypothetical protein
MAKSSGAGAADGSRSRRIMFLLIGAPFMIGALIWYVWAAWTEGAAREWPTATGA